MIDNNKLVHDIFDEFSKIERVRILSDSDKKKLNIPIAIVAWEVETEIDLDGTCCVFTFHISFKNSFPLDFPKIYLSPQSYEIVKYKPHIDSNRFICTFDNESCSTEISEPLGIVIECLKRAKKIIKEGLLHLNQSEYDNEFIAYWEDKYESVENEPKEVLSLIDYIKDEDILKLICLEKKMFLHDYILHTNDEPAKVFKEFLTDNKVKFKEIDVFYLPNDRLKNQRPPFALRNKDIVKHYINDEANFKRFKKFINNDLNLKLVFTSRLINDKEYIYGWLHSSLKTNVNGFRRGKFKQFDALLSTQANDFVQRITTEKLTTNRLENRTNGEYNKMKPFSFVVAGVGSVGSNLLFYLNSMNFPELKLIDKDVLKIENIGRHFLGFNFVGQFKTIALKDFLRQSNPLQIISTKEESILDIIKQTPEYVNNSDFLFVAIGNSNIESWLAQAIDESLIKIPTFFLWVEPYLCGGHCIFINPEKPNYQEYFENGLFKFNVISNSEYIDNNLNLTLKEAGCQTTFIPYSASNVVGFLSALFPKITTIIENSKLHETTSFTWIGNIAKVQDLDVNLSDVGQTFKIGDVIENKI